MRKSIYTLAFIIICLLCGCSESLFSPITGSEKVTLTLGVSDTSPREITVNTRATDAEERKLDNLYIYIFDGEGKLKGYKGVTSGLDQNTSDDHKADISGIKTRAGEAYIYAVANAFTAGTYSLGISEGTVEAGKLPIGLNEEDAQDGKYNFTKDMLMKLLVSRNHETIQMSSAFLMSGSVNNGKLVTIQENGSVTEDSDIKLNRTVAKFNFNISVKTGDNVKRTFTLSNYDIMNIPLSEILVGSSDNNTNKLSNIQFGNETGRTLGVNDGLSFEFYLPENLQTPKNSVSSQSAREDDNQSTPKSFTNAPDDGSYVVLKGKYTEVNGTTTRDANVTYYVHLGDCSKDPNDYNVERNCRYTFNITVAGVNNIIVEAQKESNNQPGAEGVVLEYGSAGKFMALDSHYEYMVMRFYQKDIKALKDKNHGYYYQISDINGTSGAMDVTDEEKGNLNNASKDWVEFAIGGTYNSTSNTERGTACAYPGKNSKNLYNVTDFLKLLYSHADDTDKKFWTGDRNNNNRYIDATCFVDENYYPDKTWDKFVNDVPNRYLYIANTVETSNDGRSVYAKAQYGLSQYNIQTFYDHNQSNSVVAYGCETINDEEGKGFTDDGEGGTSQSQYQSYGSDSWNGRNNMLADIFNGNSPRYTWDQLKDNKSLVKACMSRNRDLNGDGKISQDEMRWYAPTVKQYAGLWIGEEIISTESKLYNKSTSTLDKNNDPGCRMLYYTSTKGQNTYFSEEGMAFNNHNGTWKATLVRCIRNLKSNNTGYSEEPNKFYTANDKVVELDKVDAKALNATNAQGELITHTERSEHNKPAKKFQVATNKYSTKYGDYDPTQQNVVYGNYQCYGHYDENGTNWRVPNQREMVVMYLVDPTWIAYTYCRTKFSNMNFRYSWIYENNFSMWDAYWNSSQAVRCIRPTK